MCSLIAWGGGGTRVGGVEILVEGVVWDAIGYGGEFVWEWEERASGLVGVCWGFPFVPERRRREGVETER